MRETAHAYDGLPYLLFTPDAAADSTSRFPLIIFLHGRKESGGDDLSETSLAKVKATGLPRLASEDGLPLVRGGEFPFLVAAPQTEKFWKPHRDRILGLVESLLESQGADPSQCYLTGISMGAFAAWEIAAVAPDRFAALIPVSGRLPHQAKDVPDIPVWVFAGGRDKHYPAHQVQFELGALRDRRAELNLTVNPHAGHDQPFWDHIYARPYLYDWLLSHTRQGPEP